MINTIWDAIAALVLAAGYLCIGVFLLYSSVVVLHITIDSIKQQRNTESMANMVYFRLDGCDINFTAKAPEDITLKQLLKQCDRIKPDWCACGIRSEDEAHCDDRKVELFIDYEDIKKANDDVLCKILPIGGDDNI